MKGVYRVKNVPRTPIGEDDAVSAHYVKHMVARTIVTLESVNDDYTIEDDDNHSVLEVLTSATNDITITVPKGIQPGTQILVINAGAGNVNLAAETQLRPNTPTIVQEDAAVILLVATNYVRVLGAAI